MRIGVPREIKVEEYRVGLTPASVREYVAHGHDVIVEQGATAYVFAAPQHEYTKALFDAAPGRHQEFAASA